MRKPLLLILGYRSGLAASLMKNKFEYVVWNDKPVPIVVSTHAKLVLIRPFHELQKLEKDLLDQLTTFQFSAIIATKEKSVLLAAQLRQQFGLPGLQLADVLRCHDKYLMKQHAQEIGVPITEFALVSQQHDCQYLAEKWGLPFVTKPRRSAGRRGLSFIETKNTKLRRGHMAEKFINGSEFSIESLISHNKICFTNITDYYATTFANIVPGQFSSDLMQQALALNQKIINHFNISRGMTHAEFYRTADGLIFGEIAIRPPGGYIMQLMNLAYDTHFWDHFLAAELNQDIPSITRKCYSAVWIIHPGSGVVRKLSGIEALQQDLYIQKIKLTIKEGSRIKERQGVSDDCGYITLKAEHYPELLASLENITRSIRVEMIS